MPKYETELVEFEIQSPKPSPKPDHDGVFEASSSGRRRRKADADSIQVRMTYLIIDYVDCPVCGSKASQLCCPVGMGPSVFNTHTERLRKGEALYEVQKLRAEEQWRVARKAKHDS